MQCLGQCGQGHSRAGQQAAAPGLPLPVGRSLGSGSGGQAVCRECSGNRGPAGGHGRLDSLTLALGFQGPVAAS